MRAGFLFVIGFGLIIVGLVAVVAGSTGSPNASTGIVVFVGPIPIVFGSGQNAGTLVLIALVAAVGMILLIYLPFLIRRKRSEEPGAR